MTLTEHAYERARERHGLSRSAAVRLAMKAYLRGVRSAEVSGNARSYLEKLAVDHHHTEQVVYGEVVYSFGHLHGAVVLVTSFQCPREMRTAFAKAQRRKAAA